VPKRKCTPNFEVPFSRAGKLRRSVYFLTISIDNSLEEKSYDLRQTPWNLEKELFEVFVDNNFLHIALSDMWLDLVQLIWPSTFYYRCENGVWCAIVFSYFHFFKYHLIFEGFKSDSFD
jgi:hypothetical protein